MFREDIYRKMYLECKPNCDECKKKTEQCKCGAALDCLAKRHDILRAAMGKEETPWVKQTRESYERT